MKQQKDAKDLIRNRWPSFLGGRGYLNEDQLNSKKKEVSCPACGGKTRFRFDDKEGRGTFFCSHCGAGDGWRLMELIGFAFKDAAKDIREYFDGAEPTQAPVLCKPPVSDEDEKAKIRANLIRTWKASKVVTAGDPVWKYLVKTRKLPIDRIPSCIRLHPGLKYYDENGKEVGTYPVMLTAVRNAAGKATGLHRTYLTGDGEKAPVEKPKKLMKTCGLQGGAIRLAKHGKRLAIAEGIETAFAVMAITKLPCWATVSASLMPKVIVPEDVEEVLIFADNDPPDEKGRRAGQDGANALAERLRAEGKKVQVVIPIATGTDFDDVFLKREEIKAHKAARRKRPAAAVA